MSFLRRRWPLVLIALAPLLALWRCFLRGESIGPFDQIRQMAPWNGPKPDQPWEVLQADGVLQFYAWRDLVLSSWGQGTIPGWNPYQLAGTPLLANSQSGALYPPHILLGLLHVPTAFAVGLLAWFHLAWAGAGTYALVRQLGGSRVGAWLGGSMFALSPFMLAWTALPSVITTVAWIPWLLAAMAALMGGSGNRARWALALALSAGMLLLSGHLQFAAYGFLAAGLFEVALLFGKPKAEGTGGKAGNALRVALLVVAGAALAAPQVLPVLRYSEASHRRNTPNEGGYGDYLASAIRPNDVISRLANPYGQGDPGRFVAPEAPFSTFWPLLSRRAPYAESALTIGPVALVLLGLLFAGRPSGRRWTPLAVVAVVALLLALGTPLNRLLYFYAPGWSSTGSPGRVVCLFVLAMCALAGLAFPDEKIEDAKRAGIGVGVGALVALLTLVPLADPAPAGVAAEAWATIVAASSASALPFLAAVALAAFGVWAAATRQAGGLKALVGSLVVLTVVQQVPGLVRTGDPSFLYSHPIEIAADARVATVNDAWDMVGAAPAVYPPNTPSVARIHDLAGYDSLLHRDTVAVLAEANGGDPAPPANGNMMFLKRTVRPEALADAGVTEVWSRRELPAFGVPMGNEAGVFRYRVPGPGRASTPQGPARIERETLGSLTVRAVGPGLLTVRDRNLEGWSATVDGKPVEVRGARWREVELSQGEHTVEFHYAAPGFDRGLLVFGGGLIVAFLTAATFRRARSSEKASDIAPSALTE